MNRHIIKKDRIEIFNDRWYQVEIKGKLYHLRSVTTILQIIDKGYAYNEWLKNTGHNSEIIVDRAGKLGTEVHKLIEQTLLGNKVSYKNLASIHGENLAVNYWERYLVWCRYWKELNEKHEIEYKSEFVEYICHDIEEGYAGQVDLFLKVDGAYEVRDWKTGNNIGQKEHKQMCMYIRAIEKEYNIKIKKSDLVWMPTNYINKKGFRAVEVLNSDGLYDLCLATKKLFDEQHSTEKPKYLALPLEVDLEYIKNQDIIKDLTEKEVA